MHIQKIIAQIRHEISRAEADLLSWSSETEDLLSFKPSDNGWTAREVLEHITLTNHYLLILIDKATAKARQRATHEGVNYNWDDYTLVPEVLRQVGDPNSFTWIRPEHMEPRGDVSLYDIRLRLRRQFYRCKEHLASLKNGEGVLFLTTMSVNGIGKLDAYQYIYFLVLHAQRHLVQLEGNRMEFIKSPEHLVLN